MIDLSDDHLDIVRSILRRFVPMAEVLAFGSRVTGGARHYSDLDLAIGESSRIDRPTLRQLREAFEESVLPIRVDVVVLAEVTPGFRAAVLAHAEPIQAIRAVSMGESRSPATAGIHSPDNH